LRDAALAQESARWVAYTQQVLRVMQREQIQTRAIVLTSFPYPQYEQRVRAAGAYAFLNKAKEFGRVADLVRSLLPGSGQTVEKPV
jgi:DNA-binding NarL/FixJ family response regulator